MNELCEWSKNSNKIKIRNTELFLCPRWNKLSQRLDDRKWLTHTHHEWHLPYYRHICGLLPWALTFIVFLSKNTLFFIWFGLDLLIIDGSLIIIIFFKKGSDQRESNRFRSKIILCWSKAKAARAVTARPVLTTQKTSTTRSHLLSSQLRWLLWETFFFLFVFFCTIALIPMVSTGDIKYDKRNQSRATLSSQRQHSFHHGFFCLFYTNWHVEVWSQTLELFSCYIWLFHSFFKTRKWAEVEDCNTTSHQQGQRKTADWC